MSINRALLVCVAGLAFAASALAQDASSTPTGASGKRLFGIFPNSRMSPTLANYKPLSTAQKFRLATTDAFDRGTFALAAVSAAEGDLTASNPSFDDGIKAFGHYYITSFADWAVGDYMTEGMFPSLFHQDPRYFRKGTGSGLKRLWYAVGGIFWTHTDSGGKAFNISEFGGNAAAVAISQAYYPENRDASSALSKLGMLIGVDMASTVVKEFSPQISRLFSRKHRKP